MLVVANTLLDTESTKKAQERQKFLEEKCPPLELPYSNEELVVRQENRTRCPGSVQDKLLSDCLLESALCDTFASARE